jgi:hypothetical protein
MTKRIVLIALLGLFLRQTHGQDVPRFAKYDIGGGMKAYLPSKPEVEHTVSEDKSDVYTCEVKWQEFSFGVIAVKFSQSMPEESLEDLAEAYMNFIKKQMVVLKAAGYGRGHTLESNPKAKGIIDFWEDVDDNQYQVKAWVDSNYLAVMLLYGQKEFPIFNAAQMFKDGFRFPE